MRCLTSKTLPRCTPPGYSEDTDNVLCMMYDLLDIQLLLDDRWDISLSYIGIPKLKITIRMGLGIPEEMHRLWNRRLFGAQDWFSVETITGH